MATFRPGFTEQFGKNFLNVSGIPGIGKHCWMAWQPRSILLSLQVADQSINGSFVTKKLEPGDYDLCWSIDGVAPERLDPVLLDFSPAGRLAMKAKYRGDLFPAEVPESASGKAFLDFFQTDKRNGKPKGIVLLDLGGVK